MHAAVAFLLRLELLPSSPDSGITALKMGTLRSAFSGDWDTKFTGCGISEPPSGKKRQQAAMCLPATIGSKKVADPNIDFQLCSATQISSERAVKIPVPLQF